MRIADGLEVLELSARLAANVGVIHPALLWDDKDIVLLDAALPGLTQNIREAMKDQGLDFNKLSSVIVTHHDMDHIGSLGEIKGELGDKLTVYSHLEEKPYIQGEKVSIKLTPERIAQMKAQLDSLPEEQRKIVSKLLSGVSSPVDKVVCDGEELPFCGGIKVIHTPGHTPGHICLYLKKYKTLFAGDALNAADGKLMGPNPQHTYDIKEAVKSLKKLTEYDIEKVICYHGGVLSKDVNQQIAELIKSLE